ncbi:MAG: uroporphyrinogen decarboxylase family protein [candidate division KSB1 bacterium]|nr:uroporphyrinogen decarboxylase family protein [candidate division KSB1 bacterium]MDZ7346066.1 uroporphyrinogen decarboxylase family protein [candidate division KSB1 bacterium]
MNSYERFRNRLKGLPVDRVPNFDIFMQFGAHFIHAELRDYYLDYRVLVDANLAVIEAFQVDIAQAISDPYREAHDLGLKVEFPQDALPLATEPLLKDPSDLNKLKLVRPEDGRRMNDRLEAIRLFRERVGGQVPIMGWVEGALAEAADLRGVSTLMMDIFERPEWVSDLLEFCCEQEILFAKAQMEAGADLIGLGDAVASQISADWYAQYALPYEQRIFDAVHKAGGTARLHICGNTTHLLEGMAASGADIVDLDWMVDFRHAAQVYESNGPALCGNFDPVAVMLQGTPQQVEEAVRRCIADGGPRCFSAAGCEIPDGTPHANLHAQSHALAL